MDDIKPKENVILKLTFQFSLKIMEYSEQLEKNRKFVIANQILKSGTSIGAQIREAQNAESKADFLHKIKLALRKQRKQNIGYYYANILKTTQTQLNY